MSGVRTSTTGLDKLIKILIYAHGESNRQCDSANANAFGICTKERRQCVVMMGSRRRCSGGLESWWGDGLRRGRGWPDEAPGQSRTVERLHLNVLNHVRISIHTALTIDSNVIPQSALVSDLIPVSSRVHLPQ
jgi:hypothetical protein